MLEDIVRSCPRYTYCSVNNCPLDKRFPDMSTCKEDLQRKCTLNKIKRIELAKGHGLKYEGMTPGEYSAKIIWSNLTEEEKEVKDSGL